MATHGKIFDDQKEEHDHISASQDWNTMTRFMNAMLNANVVGLDAVFSLDRVEISNPFNVLPVDIRIAKITGAGTLNSGTGTYKVEEVFLNKDVITAWVWDIRTDYHIKWDTEDLGNSTEDLLVLDDIFEINGESGLAVGTLVYAMKVQRLAGDKTNIDNYQWLFVVGGASGGYDGPFKVTYDSGADEFVVGATRSAAAFDTDIVISGLDDIELTTPETIARGGNTNGYIYYSMTGQAGAPFFNITLNISNGGTIPAQTTSTVQVLLFRYFHDGSTLTFERQLQRGNITIPGRF